MMTLFITIICVILFIIVFLGTLVFCLKAILELDKVIKEFTRRLK